MTHKTVKVIIADDHNLFAEGIEQILLSLSGFEVLAKVNNGKLLLQTLNRLTPDLILLDINMPVMDGIAAAMLIKQQQPEIKIILLSMYYDVKLINEVKSDIDGFVMKDITAPELKQAILNVMGGQQVFILPEVLKHENKVKIPDSYLDRYKLSVREIEIIALIAQGKSNKEIALDLELSSYTIETHRKNIYRKLNLQGTAELTRFANEHEIR